MIKRIQHSGLESWIFSISAALLFQFQAYGAPDRVLFDFESGTYKGWTREGGEWGETPFHASVECPKWREDRRPTGWQGEWMVKTGETRHEKTTDGRLLSDTFTIDRPWLKFLLAGEVNPQVRVALFIEKENQPVRIAYGNNAYHLRFRGWDVREFQGKKARIAIEEFTPHGSLIRVDYFHLSDTPPPPLEDFSEERPQESGVVRYGEFRPLLEWNDKSVFHHTGLLKGHDGKWHLYGSIGTNAWDLCNPRVLHAAAADITGPYKIENPAMLTPDASSGEKWVRDPFILLHDGTYYAFFVGSGIPWTGWDPEYRWKEGYFAKSSQGPYGIHVAASKDLKTWTRPRKGPLFEDMPFAFNPFVTRIKDQWVMYYAAAQPAEILGHHGVACRTSTNLIDWSERKMVFLRGAKTPWPEHSFAHSPIVWERNGDWFLLTGPIGNLNLSRFHYRLLFRSKDPFHWEPDVKERTPDKGLFLEGGSKIVQDEKGRQWITHSGPWASGIWLAPLHWKQ